MWTAKAQARLEHPAGMAGMGGMARMVGAADLPKRGEQGTGAPPPPG